LAAIFEPHHFEWQNGEETTVIDYQLFKPTTTEPGKKYPLIVFLHGAGPEEFHPTVGQLNHVELIFQDPTNPAKYPFFFVAPHMPKGRSWRPLQALKGKDGVIALIDDLVKRLPINQDRITSTGLSAGATEAWTLAMRNPDTFSAIAPLAAARNVDLIDIKKLLGVSVWSFHRAGDYPERQSMAMEELANLGGCCLLTIVPGSIHDAWTPAFTEHALLDWLISQKRGEPCNLRYSGPNRILAWLENSWPQVVVLALLVCAASYWLRASRRQNEL
jgi:predicted peptidase